MKSKKKGGIKKKILNGLFLAVLLFGTFFAIFKDQDLSKIFTILSKVNPLFLLVCFVLVILYVCSESVVIKQLFGCIKIHIPLINCIRYSFVGFFFSCITPSASGGQPMQIYYMKKQNIDIPTATIVLMLVTIEYKLVLVFAGIGIALLGQDLLLSQPGEVQFFLYLGIVLNVIFVALMCLLVFLPDTAKFLALKGYRILIKLHLMKESIEREEKLSNSMEVYKQSSQFLKSHKRVLLRTTLISCLQRLFLFVITYVVYRAFGLDKENIITITVLQTVISIAVDMLPLPGGMGISERLYLVIFSPIFGGWTAATASMLFSRGFSYYILVFVSGIMTIITHLTVRGKDKSIKDNRKKIKLEGKNDWVL